MILKELVDYYKRKSSIVDSGIAPLGWSYKEIPFLISLDNSGQLLNVEDTREQESTKQRGKLFLVPHEVKRSSGIKPNFLWDTVEYVTGIVCEQKKKEADKDKDANAKEKLQLNAQKKFESFKAQIEPYTAIPAIKAIVTFLNGANLKKSLEHFAVWQEAKKRPANISFRVGNTFVFDIAEIKRLVETLSQAQNGSKGICLVSGEKDLIEEIHPSIKGILGANSTGSNIVSFNFPSACSYGKESGENAPIGKTTALKYTTALNFLLRRNSHQKLVNGNVTIVFWADKDCSFEKELVDFFADPGPDDPDRLVNNVSALLQSVKNGTFTSDNESTRFYVLGLSPNAARLSVRFWYDGTVAELSKNFAQYFQDLQIIHGQKQKDHLPLSTLLNSTAPKKKHKEDSSKLLPNLSSSLMYSILIGAPFPKTLLDQILLRCRIEKEVTYPRAKLLKGYLNRRFRVGTDSKERLITVSLDKKNANIGYCLGRLFATLERIQYVANPKIKSTIKDRFYGAASTVPITVFPTLLRLKNFHLAKLRTNSQIYFEQLLGEIMNLIQTFPPHLTMDEQGRFAIGYYHQKEDFYQKSVLTCKEQK